MRSNIPDQRKSVVVFVNSEVGHFQGVAPLIAGLARHGARVTVFTDRRFERAVRQAGAELADLFAGRPLAAVDAESIPRSARWVSFAAAHAEAIIAEVARLRPQILVHDGFAVIGRVVARVLALPRVHVCSGHATLGPQMLAQLLGDRPVRISAQCERAAAVLRDRYGLADASPFAYLPPPSPDLNVVCEPEPWLTAEERRGLEPVVFFGALPDRDDEPEAPTPWPDRPAACRVYASLGTVVWHSFAPRAIAALSAVAEALGRRSATVGLIALGGADVSITPGTANVTVARWVDQRAALRSADVFVTHHGLNSTHESVAAGVPMISYPIFWDQPGLAARAQSLGLAVPLPPAPRPGDVESALSAVVANRADFAERLAVASGWERAALAGRGAIVERILALG